MGDGVCLFSIVSVDFTVVFVVISTVAVSVAVSFVDNFVSIASTASDAAVLGGCFFFPDDLDPSLLRTALMVPRFQGRFGDWGREFVVCVAVVVVIGD